MNTDFAVLMAKQENTFYPLRFMSSDFFVPFWKCFIPVDLGAEHVRIAQDAARKCVDHSMHGERIYWSIDFSEQNALSTWQLFVKLTEKLPDEPLRHVKTLALQLAVSSDESDSADYLVNLITRVRFDEAFRRSVGYSDRDAEMLDAVYESSDERIVDMGKIKEEWLSSSSPWDLHLKSQTPDLQESVSIIFSMAYGPRTNLPLIQSNLRLILGSEEEYRAFVSRLEKAFESSLSEHVEVRFPALLSV